MAEIRLIQFTSAHPEFMLRKVLRYAHERNSIIVALYVSEADYEGVLQAKAQIPDMAGAIVVNDPRLTKGNASMALQNRAD